jgi:hypothetical protein
MRWFPVFLLLLPVLSTPVLSAPVSNGPAGVAGASAPAHHVRLTREQHFIQANVAHDGHLTLEEAKGGYPVVAKHFEDIDVDHRGYVTQNDIRAWQVMRKAARRLGKPQEGRVPSHAAAQSGYPGLRRVKASGSQIMAPRTGLPAAAQ